MNAMGHNVPTMIGVDHREMTKKIHSLVPDYMAMGERGMADMSEMTMPLPENTLPMMMGEGPYGSVEMGGMFSMLKVRKDQKKGDYSDPGWFQQPPNTQAYEFTGELQEPQRSGDAGNSAMPFTQAPQQTIELAVRKPQKHNH